MAGFEDDWLIEDFGEVQTMTSKSIKIKNDNVHFVKARALADLCKIPVEGEQYRIITEKQFNAYAFILYILETYVIEEMYLAIYRINKPTVDSIIGLIDSGNMSDNARIEQYLFENNKEVFEFHKNWMTELCQGETKI